MVELRKVVVLSFLLLSLYFFGLGLTSLPDRDEFAGLMAIGALHLGAGFGILRDNDDLKSAAKYLLFLDLIFSIIMVLGGFFLQGGSMMFLSGLTLMAMSAE